MSGVAPYLVKHLQGLIAHHQRIIDTLKGTLAILLDEGVKPPQHGPRASRRNGDGNGVGDPVVSAALALDASRRAKTPKKPGRRLAKDDPAYHTKAAIQARRQRTAAFLASLSTDTPQPLHQSKGLGPLLLAGYLKRVKGGYLRTAKEFHP